MKSANLLFIIRVAKERKQKILNLESELKKLEISPKDANHLGKYNSIKN